MDAVSGPDGQRLFVNRSEVERGSKGPFFVVYADETAGSRWGYLCSNCDRLDNAVDSMGRIRCNVCSNLHKAEEWDAAHE